MAIEQTAYEQVLDAYRSGSLASLSTGTIIALMAHCIAWHHARLNDGATDAFIALAETELNTRLP